MFECGSQTTLSIIGLFVALAAQQSGAVTPTGGANCPGLLEPQLTSELEQLRKQLDETKEYLDWQESRRLLKPWLKFLGADSLTTAQEEALALWAKHNAKTIQDPLILGRMVLRGVASIQAADRIMAAALVREARAEDSKAQAVALYEPSLVALDSIQENGISLKLPLTVQLGVKILADPRVAPALKAQLIFEQMGTLDWEQLSPLNEVLPDQREDVKRLLHERLPLMPVFEQMAKDAGLVDYPLDRALAESLRMVPIPGTSHYFAETHMTQLLYAAGGLSPNMHASPVSTHRAETHILKFPNSAVVFVNAEVDIPLFLEKLNQAAKQVGFTGQIRLPTAEEGEVATRAGTTTEFFWGDNWWEAPRYAVFGSEHQNPEDLRVATRRGNAWNLKDSVGLAMQWTQTQSGTQRVIRGGSWLTNVSTLLSASRFRFGTGGRWDSIGFRILMDHP